MRSNFEDGRMLDAACECVALMDSIPKGKMIDMDKLSVDHGRGKLVVPKNAYVELWNQDDPEWQPFTTEKSVLRSAYQLLENWQKNMFLTHGKGTAQEMAKVAVFVPADLKAVKEAAQTGEKKKVLEAILGVRVLQMSRIDPDLRKRSGIA
jgi:hypothetical protein